MCGIAGFWSGGDAPGEGSLIREMCSRIAHRGPDADGYYLDGALALGHRRLSIIDVAGGDQPLANEDGSVRTIFNGEIYNFRELRQDLVRRGHQFRTRSDTEVLVHLYEETGERLPEYLNGMFAFAIWDARRRQLFLARDRCGKKPLYYSFSIPGLRFAFASELKALMVAPGFRGRLNHSAIADFLCFSYIPDPATIFDGVYKLEPAHSLTVTAGGAQSRRYWRPEFAGRRETGEGEAAEEIRALARDAVEARLISDVPLGAFLSGGVDSSAAVGIMAQSAPDRVKTFSIGFTDKRFDELRYARIAAAHNHTDHHEETVTPSIFEILEKLMEHFDEPFGDSSAIPMLYLSRMTRQFVTVAISGDGADEIFGGYRRYYYGVLEERLRGRFPEWFRQSVIRTGARYYPKFDYLPQVFRAKSLLTNLSHEIGDSYFHSMTAFREQDLQALLANGKQEDYSPAEAYRKRFEAVRHLPPLEQMQWVDFHTYLPGDILVKADRATMAYSLESRSPWLDHRLVELACRLPGNLKISGRVRKHIFKKAMEPYVPELLLHRKKMGFSVPLAAWFRTSLKPVFESAVLSDGVNGLLQTPYLERLWTEHQSGLHNHDRKLWNLLMLALWHARYQEPSRAAALEMAGTN